MDDLILAQTDQFVPQAKLHYQVRDGLKEIVSNFDSRHDTILTQLDRSQVEHYYEWWQKLRTHLLHQADLHDQLGKNLITAGENFQTTDQNIAKSIEGKDTLPTS